MNSTFIPALFLAMVAFIFQGNAYAQLQDGQGSPLYRDSKYASGDNPVCRSAALAAGSVTASLDVEPDKFGIPVHYSGTVTVAVLDPDNNPMPETFVIALVDYSTIVSSDVVVKTNTEGEAFFAIQGVSAGSATVTFLSGTATASLPVSVYDAIPASLEVDKQKLSIQADKSGTVTATLLDIGNAPIPNITLQANSSDTGIFTVDSYKMTDKEGQALFFVTGKSKGKADVTVGVGTLTATIPVTVLKLIPSRLSFREEQVSIARCENGSITVKVFDNVGTLIPGVTISASLSKKESKNPRVWIEPSGAETDEEGEVAFTVTGFREGNATIKFKAGNVSKRIKATVKKARVIPVGTKDKVVITVLHNGLPKQGIAVTAKSSDTDVIQVDNTKTTDGNGEAKFTVSGVGEGSVVVTFTTSSASSVLKENITVIRTSRVKIGETNISITAGTSREVAITINDVNTDPVVDTNVYVKAVRGEKYIDVTPAEQKTDDNGNAVFTITGIKAGKSKIEYGVCGLSKKAGIKVLP